MFNYVFINKFYKHKAFTEEVSFTSSVCVWIGLDKKSSCLNDKSLIFFFFLHRLR